MDYKRYERPDLSEDEKRKLALAAHRITQLDELQQEIVIVSLLGENSRLAAECNQHRQALGIEPLTLYDA
jgi:ribonucleotide reductase beta subunit family protein with ferritin-like domain